MTSDRKVIPPHLQRKLNGQPSGSTTSAASTNNERALVLSTANTEDKTPKSPPSPTTNSLVSTSIQHNFSPTEMVQHDIINTLRTQIEDLRVKCDGLEAENVQMRQVVEELILQPSGSAPRGNRAQNLVGYESSDDGTPENDDAKGGVSAEYANQIAGILSNHEDRLVGLEARSAKNNAAPQSMYSGSKNTSKSGTATGGQGAISDRLDSLEQDIETGQRQVNEHHLELQDLQDWRNTVESQEGKGFDKAISTPAPQYDADFQARTERRFEQEGRIDSCFNRDELLQHYLELSRLLDHYDEDGNFQGTQDELWALRERVIMNIATFETREKVLEEARAYLKYNT